MSIGLFEVLLWLVMLLVFVLVPLAILAAITYVVVSLVRNRRR